MPHPRRTYEPGVPSHVYTRGHNKRDVFIDDDDHECFLKFVELACKKYRTEAHAFSLMKNHYHLIATPTSRTGLSRTVQHFAGQFVRHFNGKYQRSGTIWNGRHKSVAIKDERQWLTCLIYVERNPVAAGVVVSPDEYRWSSYRAHALGAPFGWLTPHRLYKSLGRTDAERQAVYRAFFDAMYPPEPADN
jgi:putative transposase